MVAGAGSNFSFRNGQPDFSASSRCRALGKLRLDVRFGSLADIATAMELVRFVPEADLSLQLEKFWQCRLDLHGE
jgi:hypothetical protein